MLTYVYSKYSHLENVFTKYNYIHKLEPLSIRCAISKSTHQLEYNYYTQVYHMYYVAFLLKRHILYVASSLHSELLHEAKGPSDHVDFTN